MGKSLLHRKEGVIISTIEVIDEVGFQNLSTKMIAKKEGISEGTLFRHFKNKTEIMRGVIAHFSKFDDAIIASNLQAELNSLQTIRNYINAYVEYYENYPALTVLVQLYDSLLAEKELQQQVKEILDKRFNFICQIVEKGQQKGEIKNDIKKEYIAHLILGGTRNICLKWRTQGYAFSLKKETMEMLEFFLGTL